MILRHFDARANVRPHPVIDEARVLLNRALWARNYPCPAKYTCPRKSLRATKPVKGLGAAGSCQARQLAAKQNQREPGVITRDHEAPATPKARDSPRVRALVGDRRGTDWPNTTARSSESATAPSCRCLPTPRNGRLGWPPPDGCELADANRPGRLARRPSFQARGSCSRLYSA